jgi:hypothetical protein
MSIASFFSDNKGILTTGGVTLALLIIGFFVFRRSSSGGEAGVAEGVAGVTSSSGSYLNYAGYIVVILLIAGGSYLLYMSMHGDPTESYNLLPNPAKTETTLKVTDSNSPVSSQNWGVQFWMHVDDWNKGYGQAKSVFVRQGMSIVPNPTSNVVGNPGNVPNIYLHPTENTLIVEVPMSPSDSGPSPVNQTGSSSNTFQCEIRNIPLQSIISIAVSCSGRNLDLYMNGQLVRSCLTPEVPLAANANGDGTVMQGSTFNGAVYGIKVYSRGLTPADASSYFSAGAPALLSAGATLKEGSYKVKLGIVNPSGKEIRKFVL